MDTMRSISVPSFRSKLVIIGGIMKGFQGVRCSPTCWAMNAEWVENRVDDCYGANIVGIQHEGNLVMLGKKVWSGREEARS